MRIFTSYMRLTSEGIGINEEISDMFPTRDDAIADAEKMFRQSNVTSVFVCAEEITNTGRRTICQVFSKEREDKQ